MHKHNPFNPQMRIIVLISALQRQRQRLSHNFHSHKLLLMLMLKAKVRSFHTFFRTPPPYYHHLYKDTAVMKLLIKLPEQNMLVQ